MTARDIMTRCVRTVPADGTLGDALTIMDQEGFSQLPVMQGTKPVGMLTERDVRLALAEHREDRPLGDLASPLPTQMHARTRISSVLQAMQQQESVLVVTKMGRLQGIITYWDVLLLGRPAILVKEVELVLRRVVTATYEGMFGLDWWDNVPRDLRERAEEEHRQDEDEEPTPEHMLGHTSFWALIEIFKRARPDLPDARFQELHRVRVLRNRVSHYYRLTDREQQELLNLCLRTGDWLESMLPSSHPLGRKTER